MLIQQRYSVEDSEKYKEGKKLSFYQAVFSGIVLMFMYMLYTQPSNSGDHVVHLHSEKQSRNQQ